MKVVYTVLLLHQVTFKSQKRNFKQNNVGTSKFHSFYFVFKKIRFLFHLVIERIVKLLFQHDKYLKHMQMLL
jgi:hypothetical protein